MATYKKGFKKKGSEQGLLKVIVGILVSVAILVGFVAIYDFSTRWEVYTNYSQVTEYNGIFDKTDADGQELADYAIYIYKDSCPACAATKLDVLRVGRKINRNNEFFILNTGNMTDNDAYYNDFLISIDIDPTDTNNGLQTPTLIVVIDGEFDSKYEGATDILSALNSISDGTYDGFDLN